MIELDMFNFMKKSKKEVIAYVHTHWDREWYREFEIFRLRLLRVFDHILDMLEQNKIPSFYFDGQVSALLDYLEIRPEKEELIRKLVSQKRLFIGPFYCLVDEMLTDGICFRKNLEIGLKVAKNFGCNDFIGYFADTFGHSKNIPAILKEFNIDKAIVWRGCGNLPSEFIFNGVPTVNLIRGYFMDIFSSNKTIEEKAKFLEENLDKIAEFSEKILLLPIGADHLDIPDDLNEQINQVNKLLKDYEIHLGSPFEYFSKVKFKKEFNDELRDNTKTFILPGSYSARTKLKQLNTECSYILDIANKLQLNFGGNYNSIIEYAYELLLQNQAHDSICGCSTDDVHEENIIRYKKILQIANTIIEEIKLTQPDNLTMTFKYLNKYKLLQIEKESIDENSQVINERMGFPAKLLYDTNKIPITEDYTRLYTLLKEFNSDGSPSDLAINKTSIKNSNIKLAIENNKINLYINNNCYENFIEFTRCKDLGDSYNYAPDINDKYDIAEIKTSRVIMNGPLRSTLRVTTSFFNIDISLNKKSMLLNFKINWLNLCTNKLWQVKFNLNKPVEEVFSEDMNLLISRKFDSSYSLRNNLPNNKGIEAKTNTAPFQRFAWSNGFGVITKGLTEYEVQNNSLLITILRSNGIISNPKNPARTTPAGPPIKVPGLQQIGSNRAEFSIGFFNLEDWASYVEEIYPQTILL